MIHSLFHLVGAEIVLEDLDLRNVLNFEYKLLCYAVWSCIVESAQGPFDITCEKVRRVFVSFL